MSSRVRKRVRWLAAALDDLDEIVAAIAADAPQAAERLASTVFEKIKLLATVPELGSVCPYYPKARQLIHGNYVIYYSVHSDEVTVRAVVHGARLFRPRWFQRKNP